MNDYIIETISIDSLEECFELIRKVFLEFNAPQYSQEGINQFISQILENQQFIHKFNTGEQTMIGAFYNDKIIGVLAISIRNHISLLFVDKEHHRKGIATKLFDEMLNISKSKNIDTIKLNSAPYAIPFYKNLGFIPTDTEQSINGIRYTPMEFKL